MSFERLNGNNTTFHFFYQYFEISFFCISVLLIYFVHIRTLSTLCYIRTFSIILSQLKLASGWGIFLTVLKTRWWTSVFSCSLVGQLFLWHIPRSYSQLYFYLNKPGQVNMVTVTIHFEEKLGIMSIALCLHILVVATWSDVESLNRKTYIKISIFVSMNQK